MADITLNFQPELAGRVQRRAGRSRTVFQVNTDQ